VKFECSDQVPDTHDVAAAVVQGEAADQDALTSAGLLNLLTAKQRSLAGDRPSQLLLGRLLEAAAQPYFGILEKWLCRGELDDPYHEFMVKVSVKLL
jgi:gamma-tubulin complex component 2